MPDPYDMAGVLQDAWKKMTAAVDQATRGLSGFERERALFALVSAHSLAEEMWVFEGDPPQPAFTEWMRDGRKTAGDSPYTAYLSTPISARHTYRLSGNLGECTYFGMQLYRQIQGFNAPGSTLSFSDLVVADNGNFEVIASKERPDKAANWLQLQDGDCVLMRSRRRTATSKPSSCPPSRLPTC
jgi:hypothetical protein